MSETIISALITAGGSILGALIGAAAPSIITLFKAKKGEADIAPSPLWKWAAIGAIIGAIVLGAFLLLGIVNPGTTFLKEDFQGVLNKNITGTSGNWQVISEGNNKVWDIDNSSSPDYAGVNFGIETWQNYTIQYRLEMINFVPGATPEVILYFRNDISGNRNVQAITPDYNGSKLVTLAKTTNNSGWQAITAKEFPFETGRWYTVKVVAQDDHFKIYVDNSLLIDATDAQVTAGGFNLQVGPGAHVRFDDLLVTGND